MQHLPRRAEGGGLRSQCRAARRGQGSAAPITKELVTHPDVAIIDFTGSPAFGRWVRENAKGAQVYTEEAGVNSIVIDSTPSFKGMCGNIAFSLVLYSGQMCTAPQDIFVPRDGIDSDEGHKSFDDVARGIAGAVEKLIGNPERAAALLGTLQSEATTNRVKTLSERAKPLLASKSYEIAGSPGARTATPAIFVVDAADATLYGEEQFGPISFMVATADTREAIDKAVQLARKKAPSRAASTPPMRRCSTRRPTSSRRWRQSLVQPDGRHLRQPECGLQRLSCQRRQSGRQRVPDGYSLRGQPFPCDRHQEAGRGVKKVRERRTTAP